MTNLLAGGHGGQVDPVAEAQARGAGLAQFFLGDPQAWKGPQVAFEGGAAALRTAAADAGVTLYVHAPYVLNVATTNNRIRIPSRKFLQQHLDAAAEIGAAGLVVHGGHVLKADDPALGIDNWRKCVERLDLAVPLLIENTAGGDNAMARHLDRLDQLWGAVGDGGGAGVGFCLDTCHAHAAGEDLDGSGGPGPGGHRADRSRARQRLARRRRFPVADRHTNLGDGQIDPEALVAVVREAGAPVVVETPGGPEGQRADLDWLRARLA